MEKQEDTLFQWPCSVAMLVTRRGSYYFLSTLGRPSKAKDVQYVKHYPKMLGPGEEFVEELVVPGFSDEGVEL